MRAVESAKIAERRKEHVSVHGRGAEERSPWVGDPASPTDHVHRNAPCVCGGRCPACQRELPIQTKLAISEPGDIYEQEADRVADQVMHMPERAPRHDASSTNNGTNGQVVQRQPLAPTITALIKRQSQVQAEEGQASEDEPDIQRFAAGDAQGGEVPENFAGDLGPGNPLDPQTRSFFEPRFGMDFSDVRVHTDSRAAASARAVHAKAYTLGHDVVFGAGQFDTGSAQGRQLIAHELTHVIQQSARSAPTLQRVIAVDVLITQITPEQAAQMTDLELDGEIQRLRRHLAELSPSTSDYMGASENLQILETIVTERQRRTSRVALEDEAVEPELPSADITDTTELDQCIAELGGSPGYRDGGIASAEELERYRQECMARQTGTHSVSRAIENLGRAWEYAQERLAPEVRREVANLFSPASLAMMAAFAVLYVASQLTPVGWVADALALTVLTLTVIFVGALVIDIAADIFRFFSAVNATTDDELRESGHALARALARGGVGIFVALLTHGLRGATRPPTPTAGAPVTALVEVVVAGGGRARIPITAATAADAVEASRLQALASYAVMVPPPGGASPSAPSSTSSSGRGSGSGEPVGGEGGGRRSGTGVGSPGGLGPIPYGESALSLLAQRFRVALGLRRGGNVAVFEFESLPDSFRALASRLGGRNVRIEGNRMAVQNVGGSAHSEQLGHLLITEGRRSGIQLNVLEIYTEYNPCTDTCLPLIREYYPNARVTYSFIWELWGRETPDRNAAVDALFAAEE